MTRENTPLPDSYMVRTFFTPPETLYGGVLGIDDIRFTGNPEGMVDFEWDKKFKEDKGTQ
jgi:hypothetical protein